MEPIYNFGMSQDDARTEARALELKPGDRMLCIASGGEVPLNLLAMEEVKIDAVDISPGQLNLSKLKLHAALTLEPVEAARFLGFMEADPETRRQYFDKISGLMDEGEKAFWQNHPKGISYGGGELRLSLFPALTEQTSGGSLPRREEAPKSALA